MSGGDWKELYLAAQAGDLDLVRYHVESGVDVNYSHPEFMSTALVAAILARQTDVANYLLDAGADPDLLSEMDDLTPLEAARSVGVTGLVERLSR